MRTLTSLKTQLVRLGAVLSVCASAHMAAAEPVTPAPDPADLIQSSTIDAIRAIVDSELVLRSVEAQNARYGRLTQTEIDDLDKQWRAERENTDKSLISMTLSNPLSSYLTRMQANALGLYGAIFVMDQNGLNVGQSAITGDFWQGDEAKFQKTFPAGANAIFIDEPEWLDDFKVWIAQVNMTLSNDNGKPIGAVTFDVNLTELARRQLEAATN